MDLDGELILSRVAIETVDIVVDKDLELERILVGREVADLPIMLDDIGDISPSVHLREVDESSNVDLVLYEALSKSLCLLVGHK